MYKAITRCWRGGAFEFFSRGNNVAAVDCCRYKDNRAYPWPGGESHFILYPESANQTIYAQKVRASDAGRYSCQARNDTTILEGDITLAVLGQYLPRFAKHVSNTVDSPKDACINIMRQYSELEHKKRKYSSTVVNQRRMLNKYRCRLYLV